MKPKDKDREYRHRIKGGLCDFAARASSHFLGSPARAAADSNARPFFS